MKCVLSCMEDRLQQADPHRLETGRRLAELRGRLGRTQVELAEELGVSYRSIQSYESGKQDVPSEVLRALHSKYCTSSDWLLFGPSVAPETGDRLSGAAEMAQRTYDVWEALLSKAAIPVPVEAKKVLFNVFVDLAIRNGELSQGQMQRAAENLIQRVEPKD